MWGVVRSCFSFVCGPVQGDTTMRLYRPKGQGMREGTLGSGPDQATDTHALWRGQDVAEATRGHPTAHKAYPSMPSPKGSPLPYNPWPKSLHSSGELVYREDRGGGEEEGETHYTTGKSNAHLQSTA